MNDRSKWKLLSGAAAVVAGGVIRYGMNRGWTSLTDTPPPGRPERRDRRSWAKAAAWTLSVAAAVGLARMVAREGAAVVWRRTTGDAPG